MSGPHWMGFGTGDTGPTALRLRVSAYPENLFPIRRMLGSWLDSTPADEDEVIAMQIAAGEATTNAVEHAYLGREPGPVLLTAEVEDGDVLRVEIADRGRWRPEGTVGDGRGRGLLLMRECVDQLNIAHSLQGTTVVLRLWLRAKGLRAKGPGADSPPRLREQ